MAIDQFAAWRRRLKGEVVAIVNEQPDPGFYRNRGVPVAYWFEADPKFDGEWTGAERGGVLRCHIAGKAINDRDRMNTTWSFAVKEPVTKQYYDEFLRTGTWPDQSPVVTLSNSMPADDGTLEGLTAQIDMLANEAEALMAKGAAKTQTEADHAADVATRLGELNSKADNLRKKEKQPHWDEACKVDDKWRSVIARSSIYTLIKGAIINPFLKTENARRQAESQALLDEAAERARLQRIADDAARTAAETTTDHVEGSPADAAPPQPPQYPQFEAPMRATPPPAFVPASAGTRGRKVTGRKTKVARIDDYAKALNAFAEHPDVKALIQDLANKAAKIGMPTAGCEIVDDESAV